MVLKKWKISAFVYLVVAVSFHMNSAKAGGLTHTCAHTYTAACIHTCMHAHTHACMHTHIRTHTHADAYTHMHTHTYTDFLHGIKQFL